MPKYFLKSYHDLKYFLEKAEALMQFSVGDDWKKYKVALAILAINKYQSRQTLDNNDYFKTIVPEYEANNISFECLESADKVISLLYRELRSKNVISSITLNEQWNIIYIGGPHGCAFVVNPEKELISTMIDDGFKIQRQERVNSNDQFFFVKALTQALEIEINSNSWKEETGKTKLVSLFSLLTLLFDCQKESSGGALDAKDWEYFYEYGYLVKENFINITSLNKLKELTYSIANLQKSDGSAYLYGKKKELQRIYNLIGKSTYYIDLLLDERIEQILEQFFKRDTLHQKYYLSSFQANILYPGAESQMLHTDLAVPEPLPVWPVRLNINITLDEFNQKNGGTLILPGSHKLFRKPTHSDEHVTLKPVEAPPGSLVIWSGHLWHKSGPNTSNSPRAALLACYSASYLREISMEENYLQINSATKLKSFPKRLIELIGGNHGNKVSG